VHRGKAPKLFPPSGAGKCMPSGASYPWFPGVASRLHLEPRSFFLRTPGSPGGFEQNLN
jgi:hypothetical protein